MTAGIILTFFIACVASYLGGLFPLIGGPIFAILIGIILANIWGRPAWAEQGLNFTGKKILQWSIIALGGSLSFEQVLQTGLDSLSIMIFTLSSALVSAYFFGRMMRIPWRLNTLVGVGTAICGGSAIAAISPVIEAEDDEIAYAISTIFFFNILAAFSFPILGHLLGFSDQGFGLWAGTAINDTSSVVAAGYAFSSTAGDYATIVKMTRTTMIIPICFVAAILMTKHKAKNAVEGKVNCSLVKIFPWFILGFLGLSVANTMGLFNSTVAHGFGALGKFMIIMALAAIGYKADLKKMFSAGVKPILLGYIIWFVVSVVAFAVQFFTGRM